ncbi:hypothetical protein HPC37_02810 [Pasteurellaceae bacterium 20609_3]|uniref:hypothetical protein n=1 Tax=Spirabiliibacterium mucosae TaxID=28156 RepID=UPI001AAC7A1C|nr:hypothetical protein [Spirabiliibacterium mucosae]MBE2897785.1 hypothetical protein [Spirabiliibacterium mucosae]
MAVADLDYTELADQLALFTGGIPEHVVIQVIPMCVSRVAAETKTLAGSLTAELDDHDTFHFDLDDDREVIEALSAKINGKTVPFIDRRRIVSATHPCCCLIEKYSDDGRESVLQFFNIGPRDADSAVEASVSYTFAPTLEATSCPVPRDSNLFIRVVRELVLYELYIMPNRPWTDFKLAGHHLANYDQLIVELLRKGQVNDMPSDRVCAFSW